MKKKLLVLPFWLIVIVSLPALSTAYSHFSLFPLVYYHSDAIGKELFLLYPFIDYQGTKDEQQYALHPLFSVAKSSNEVQQKSIHFVWPFFRYEFEASAREDSMERTVTLSPLLEWYKKKKRDLVDKRFTLLPLIFLGSQGKGRYYLVLFPVFWLAKEAKIYIPFYSTRRQSSLAIFPLFGWFKNLWGRDRIIFFCWPLLCLSHDKDSARFHLVWPIFNVIKKKQGFGFRVWPLIGYAHEKDRLKKLYVLWPLIHHQRLWTEEGQEPDKIDMVFPFWISYKRNGSQLKYVFPFFGMKKTPGVKRTSYFWPIYTVSESTIRQTKEWGFLFSLIRYKKGPAEKTWEFFPLFKYTRQLAQRRAYFLWPLFSYRMNKFAREQYSRHYIPPLFMYKRRIEDTKEIEDKRLIFCPFVRTHYNRYLGTHTQFLWPLWYDDIKGMKRNYEQLWTLYYSDEASGEKSVWGRLYFQKQLGERSRKELNLLLFNYYSDPDIKRYDVLGGLFGWERRPHKKILRLLFLPITI